MENNGLKTINILDNLDKTFLIGGYRNRKGQLAWILGNKYSRKEILYNVHFSPIKKSHRDGTISSGELPDFIVIYDYTDKNRKTLRLFKCLSYCIYNEKEMDDLFYPNPSGSYIVYRLGDEYDSSFIDLKRLENYSHLKYPYLANRKKVPPFIIKGEDIQLSNNGKCPLPQLFDRIRIVDLFAGLGGFHHAFDKLGKEMGFEVDAVYVSELKNDLRRLYANNYKINYDCINPDITLLDTDEEIERQVPEHDILCGVFPCQPFSKAGKQEGFEDSEGRGILFNYIANIIRVRRPKYIFLENVSNLETHDYGRTWQTIKDRLSNDEQHGGLNYDLRVQVISPHEYGYPQHRKRIYIVGIDRRRGNLDDFRFPVKPNKATCDINGIIETEPTHPQSIKEKFHYIQVWQQFLDFCNKHKSKLPQAPIWAMEFGATYDYSTKAPAYQSISEFVGKKGKLGQPIIGSTVCECLECLPNYAQTNKNEKFPDWKIKYIRENRIFYNENKEWIDEWKKQIVDWNNSFMKLEWNCDVTEHMSIWDKILQFRPSGLRVKRPTYSPALTFMSSQIPIFPDLEFYDENGKVNKGRYMTLIEAARVQGMGDLSFDGLPKARIYEALGNAVDVEIIKMIAKSLIYNHNNR